MNRILLVLMVALGLAGTAYGQTGAGSFTSDNSRVTIAPGTVELRFSESSYFGPNSEWEIHGTLEIWSKNIWIAPTARFTGTGRIIIHDPSTNPYYEDMAAAPTLIDGNDGNPIGVAVELRNPNNLVLSDIADPGYGLANPAGSRAAALHLGSLFEFAVDGGDVMLNGHDMLLSAESSLLGYGPRRMVVTSNSVDGHLVKTYANRLAFTFPVGIAEGDYTPATLAPQDDATLYVGVQDYGAAGIELPDPEEGMDRIWHIYADAGVSAIYTLQHNMVTNGLLYVDDEAEIVQYAGGTNWIGDVTTLEGEGIHTRADIMVATGTAADGSWLTKLAYDDSEVVDPEDVGPTAVDDAGTVESGSTVQIVVLANDEPGSSPIVANLVRITRLPANGTVVVNPDGSVTYAPNDGFVGEDTFEYEIEDENGLTDRAEVRITVTARKLRIPNVFTPNGDGRNDYFEIEGIEGFDRIEITVVNRWGNEVYRNTNYNNDWNGGSLNEGTYYYQIVTFLGNQANDYTGWVLIKRE